MAKKGEVTATFKADTKNFEKGSRRVRDEATTLERRLKKLGPAGALVSQGLDKIGLSSLGGASGVLIATAAIGAGVAVVEKAIDAYTNLVTRIDHYKDVTGQSAEASSRQVQVFQELGVSEDIAAAGMVKLSKAIETAPEKLKALGVEVVRDVKGNVDLTATLLNVANAWQTMTDPAERNLLVLTAFGKAGAAMIPILETNAAEFRRLSGAIDKVFTQDDIEKIREYKIAQRELQRAADDWGVSLGQAVLPAQLAVYESLNRNIYIQKRLNETYAEGYQSAQQTRFASNQLAQAFTKEYDEANKARDAADRLAQSQKDATDSALREAEAEETLSRALHKNIDAGFAYEQALIDLRNAQKDVTKAGGDAQQENLRLRESYVRVADAAVTLAEHQAEVAGTTFDVNDANKVWEDTLIRLISRLDPKSPLRKYLQGLIDKMRALEKAARGAAGATASVGLGSNIHPGGGGVQEFASGGTVPGPSGSAQLAVVHGGETVIPAGRNGGGNHVHLHIGTLIGADGPGMDRLANEILRRARFAPGR